MLKMTPEEIAGSYRRAVNQSAQINVLTELNACSREEIIKTLKEQGFKIKTTKRGRKKTAETPETLGTTERTSPEENTAESIAAAVPEDKGTGTSKSENAAVSESEGAAVPDIVKTAVRKEMIVVQKNIDNIQDQDKSSKNNNERAGKYPRKTYAEFKNIETILRIKGLHRCNRKRLA